MEARMTAESIPELRREIVTQIGELARVLGQIPPESDIAIDSQRALMKLSVAISRALDIQIP